MSYSVEENFLISKSIKPTPNRVLVVRELLRATHPISLGDLEKLLGYSMDKASIFRVLELLSEKEVTHVIENGSRSLKYELCHAEGPHDASDQHPHFYCARCGTVYCLDDVTIPAITLPAGYQVKSTNFMFKGICPKCSEGNS